MGQELASFNLSDGGLDQLTKFLPLIIRDGRAQVLNLGQALAYENHYSRFSDAAHPGVTDQLRVERQQACRLFRIAAAGGLPLQQAAGAVQIPEGIDIGHEVLTVGKLTDQLGLQVAPRLADADAIIPSQLLQQLHALASQPLPVVPVAVLEWTVLVGSPFLEQGSRAVLRWK